MTPELLRLQTYDKVFQRLVSTNKEIPLGIYRTSKLTSKSKDKNKNKVCMYVRMYVSTVYFRMVVSEQCSKLEYMYKSYLTIELLLVVQITLWLLFL